MPRGTSTLLDTHSTKSHRGLRLGWLLRPYGRMGGQVGGEVGEIPGPGHPREWNDARGVSRVGGGPTRPRRLAPRPQPPAAPPPSSQDHVLGQSL